jgi:hypothetical protein
MEIEVLHHKYNVQKSSKRNQNPSSYYNSTITKSQVSTQAKISSLKNPHKNRPITYGPKSLKLLYSIMNLNTVSLPW